MSIATASLGLAPWTPAIAIVVGGRADARASAADVLREAGFAVAMAASTGDLAGMRHDPPDGLLVLLTSGNLSTRVRTVREAAAARPRAHILAVMPHDPPNAALRRVLLAGASGIVLEDEVDRALAATAQAIAAGQLAVPGVLGRQLSARPLSHREKQILSLVVLGMTNREIAHKLYLAESTVKTHLSSAFRKLDARSRSEAVAHIQDPEAGYGAGILALADRAQEASRLGR